MSRARLVVRGVSKTWATKGRRVQALHDVSLELRAGEFVCLLGASGCGKSTLLNVIAGLEEVDYGEVRLDGTQALTADPRVGMVFQKAALFPWLTVGENIGFGLRGLGLERAARRERVEELLTLIGLTESTELFPRQLSGGMAQRVAVARALAREPEVLLMDEPFGALDAQTREMLQKELLRIWEQNGCSIVFVTHSVQEAVYLADRVVTMAPGPGRIHAIRSIDLPRERDVTSAEFGEMSRQVYGDLYGSRSTDDG